MAPASAPSSPFPDRPPTWTDVAMAVGALVMVPLHLPPADAFSLPLAILGFLLVVVVLGPLTGTSIGGRVDRWSRTATGVHRAVLLVLLLLPVLVLGRLLMSSGVPVISGICGVYVGIATFVFLHVLSAGAMSGWNWG